MTKPTSEEFITTFLEHGGFYDPAKAREYYLRTRKLKGRNSSAQDESRQIHDTKVLRNKNRQKRIKELIAKIDKFFEKAGPVFKEIENVLLMPKGPKQEAAVKRLDPQFRKMVKIRIKLENEVSRSGLENEVYN